MEYVWRDCYMNCWTDTHYPYVVLAALAILVYIPIAVYSRPLWQQAKTGLNIMNKPKFLLVKTCIQILLVSVGKSLQGTSMISHGVVFSFLMIVFIWMTYRIRPFNYDRFNVWELASLLAVLYISLLAVFSSASDPENIGWFVGLLVGWGVIFIGAYLIQRKFFPNYLVPPGGGRTNRRKDGPVGARVMPVGSDALSNDFMNDNPKHEYATPGYALPGSLDAIDNLNNKGHNTIQEVDENSPSVSSSKSASESISLSSGSHANASSSSPDE
jgi:hypothetical protein